MKRTTTKKSKTPFGTYYVKGIRNGIVKLLRDEDLSYSYARRFDLPETVVVGSRIRVASDLVCTEANNLEYHRLRNEYVRRVAKPITKTAGRIQAVLSLTSTESSRTSPTSKPIVRPLEWKELAVGRFTARGISGGGYEIIRLGQRDWDLKYSNGIVLDRVGSVSIAKRKAQEHWEASVLGCLMDRQKYKYLGVERGVIALERCFDKAEVFTNDPETIVEIFSQRGNSTGSEQLQDYVELDNKGLVFPSSDTYDQLKQKYQEGKAVANV